MLMRPRILTAVAVVASLSCLSAIPAAAATKDDNGDDAKSGDVGKSLSGLGDAVGHLATSVADEVTTSAQTAGTWITEKLDKLGTTVSGTGEKAQKEAEKAQKETAQAAETTADKAQRGVANGVRKVSGALNRFADKVSNAASGSSKDSGEAKDRDR